MKVHFDRVPTPSALANRMNYMATSFAESATFQDHRFLGLLPVEGQGWGIDIDGINHVAVHLFRTPEGFYWGGDPKDTEEHARRSPWVLMFLGIDNSSCFLRYAKRETAIRQISSMTAVRWNMPGMMFYNS